jgi:ribosomal-protein-alanine N-acetyltransferase
MSGIVLIAAGPQHAAVVAALHAATMAAEDVSGEGWSADWVARILALPGAVAALALAPGPDGGPVGFALCLPAGEAFDLLAIGVLPGRRRAGIARGLLARCEERSRAAGAARLMLEVAEDNAGARAFYADAGFGEVGRRRRYYRARGAGAAPRDALVLRKDL